MCIIMCFDLIDNLSHAFNRRMSFYTVDADELYVIDAVVVADTFD